MVKIIKRNLIVVITVTFSLAIVGCNQPPQTISTYELKEIAENADRDVARINKEKL